MAQVVVLELPDDADLQGILRSVGALAIFPPGCQVYAAVRESADEVLAFVGRKT